MNKKIVAIISILTFSIIAESKQPLFVLIERDPWLMVIGSDSPSFTLYSDSTIIFWQSYEKERKRKKGKGFKLYTSKLNDSLFTYIQNILLEEDSVKALDRRYELIQATDQPDNEFHWFINGKRYFCSVYGHLGYLFQEGNSGNAFLSGIIKTIKTFSPEVKQEWHPEKIEVMVWSYEYAPDKSIIWPDNWPDLKHATTINRSKSWEKAAEEIPDTANSNLKMLKKQYEQTESYSLFLPYSEYDNLIAFLKTKKHKGAVVIDGKKMAVSLRFPFPTEEIWMNKEE